MPFRQSQLEARQQFLASYDADEAAKYDAWISSLKDEDHAACLEDIQRSVTLPAGAFVLDAGAGTGALCLTLQRVSGVHLTALEPCVAMGTLLQQKPELNEVEVVNGFCDHLDDRDTFASAAFDIVACQLLTNCLYDPLAAFRNWHYWLKPGGKVITMDGLFDRTGWSGRWEGLVDTLPLAACRTTATVPYLLEEAGFDVCDVAMMASTNDRPSTRTSRYLVVATKN